MISIKTFIWDYGTFNATTQRYENSHWRRKSNHFRVPRAVSSFYIPAGMYVDVNRELAFEYSEDVGGDLEALKRFEAIDNLPDYVLPTYTIRHYKLYKTNVAKGCSVLCEEGTCIGKTGDKHDCYKLENGDRIPVLDEVMPDKDEDGCSVIYVTDKQEYPLRKTKFAEEAAI